MRLTTMQGSVSQVKGPEVDPINRWIKSKHCQNLGCHAASKKFFEHFTDKEITFSDENQVKDWGLSLEKIMNLKGHALVAFDCSG